MLPHSNPTTIKDSSRHRQIHLYDGFLSSKRVNAQRILCFVTSIMWGPSKPWFITAPFFFPLFLSWCYFLSVRDPHWIKKKDIWGRELWSFRVGGGVAILNLVTVRFRSLRSSLWVSGIVSVLSAYKRAADGWGKCSLICSACTAANQH